MKYAGLVATLLLAAVTVAEAQDVAVPGEDELVDIRVSCIEQGIADEVNDDQMDAFVEKCIGDELAARKTEAGNKG